jgi:flagellar biosynthesis protein FlhF
MQTRTFQARQIKEALALVRRELGPDAIIVETKRVPGRALGLLGGSFIQVTASPPEGNTSADGESPTAGQGRTSANSGASASGNHGAPALGPGHALPAARTNPSATATDGKNQDADAGPLLAEGRARRAQKALTGRRSLHDQITDDPQMALSAATARGRVLPHAALRRRLLAAMVPRDLCEAWLSQLPDLGPTAGARANEEVQLRALVTRLLGDAAPLCNPGSRVAALVGPTGVGKTTTIAKLAAHAHLVERKRVAIVSLDDQRIGSTTQLRAYANLLELPLITATAAGGLPRALASVRDADLVLVDTAGISPGRRDDFDELARRLARAGEPVTTHLCIAASTRIEELERILHLYGVTEPSAVIATKVDEAVAIGTAVAARTKSGAPLSFVTTGQQVPEDLATATPNFVLDLLLGGARA